MASGALEGIRVLDLSRILAGPWATQNLADLGAEVIKIEKPREGDDTRQWGPPFVSPASGARLRESTYFLCCNRGKRSMAVDFTQPQGADLLKRMAGEVDILVENFKVGGLAAYGLDYASLSELHPRLIYCSITGFGQSGPYATRPGYDALIQAMGGLMSITGEADVRPGGGPQKVGVAIIDLLSGMYATTAILAALHERARSGRGQHIDISLFNVQAAALANQASAFLIAGQVPGRLGSAHPSIAPYQPFATRDGHVMLAIANDRQFTEFCESAGQGELARDSRFTNNEDRVRHRDALVAAISSLTVMKSTEEWTALGVKHGFPCGPINSIDRVFKDPHARATGLTYKINHPALGEIESVINPMRFSRSSASSRRAPPGLGEHTQEVLEEFGLSASDIDALKRSGSI